MSDLHERAMALLHETAGIERDGLAGLLAWIQDSRVAREDVARLRAEVRDLKARLKAVRKREQRPCYSCGSPQTVQPSITDLRCKNWRKP